MLKIRVIPTLLWNGQGLVKGVSFDSWRVVGTPVQAIRIFNMRAVDELVFVDIRATAEGRPPDFALIDQLADDCFVPFAVGGGVRNLADVRALLRAGADKVIVNTAAVEHPSLVSEIANNFGSQCVVVSIDGRQEGPGQYRLCTHAGKAPTDTNIFEHAQAMEKAGAGEILLTSIDRDGTMKGYDVDLLRRMSEAVRIPVIASGGAGNAADMENALRDGKVSAVAAGSMFQFTEQTPLEVKQHLAKCGFPMRL